MRQSTVSIELFGAVGDGVTNDTAAFTAMVTYLAANGGVGVLPAGTYLISPSVRTFTNNKPFVIRGEGKGISIIRNSTSNTSFIYWTTANNVTIENLTIDGNYTGTQDQSSGGHLVFVNSSYVTVRNVRMEKFRRVGLMIFNDHQTTLSNIYTNIDVDGVDFIGNNKIDGTGPSAVIIADVNNSRIRNSYCEEIGLYGFEFKNDCSNTVISDCITKNTYYPIYYGGDGSQTQLGYVKDSVITGISITGTYWGGVVLGRAYRNVITGITINGSGYIPIDIGDSLENVISGISLNNVNATASYPAIRIRSGCLRNTILANSIVMTGALSTGGAVVFDSGANNNTVQIHRCTASSGVPANLWNDAGSGNAKSYLS